jgi:hypothetical protein
MMKWTDRKKYCGKKLKPLTDESKKYLEEQFASLVEVSKMLVAYFKGSICSNEIESEVYYTALKVLSRGDYSYDSFDKIIYNLVIAKLQRSNDRFFSLPQWVDSGGNCYDLDVVDVKKDATLNVVIVAYDISEIAFEFVDNLNESWLVTTDKTAEDHCTFYFPERAFLYFRDLCVERMSLNDIGKKRNAKPSAVLSSLSWYLNVMPHRIKEKRKLRNRTNGIIEKPEGI